MKKQNLVQEKSEITQTLDFTKEMPKNEEEKEDKQISLLRSIRESIAEIVAISSVHGVPNLMATKRVFIKYMWLFFILGSSGVCGYFVSNTILDYLNYDVVSVIDIINEQYSEFPTISVCSSTGELDLPNAIISCSFNSDAGCKDRPSEYFEEFLDPLYGSCYRFNSGKNSFGNKIDILNSSFGGLQFGFLLNLKLPKPDYIDFTQMIISIDNSSFNLISLYNNEIFISPGSRSYISVKRTFNVKLDQPYNDCYKSVSDFNMNKTIINYITNSSKKYSQKECLRICINLKYLEETDCGCSAEWDTAEFVCLYKMISLNRTIFDCTWSFYKEILKKTYEVCADYCPLECDSITYSVSFSSIYDYPSSGEILNSELGAFFDYSDVKASFFTIQVFYENLNYELITQQPKVLLSDLIPNIGGIMGLFLGTSFLSLIELFEWLFEIFFVLYDLKIKSKNKINSQNHI